MNLHMRFDDGNPDDQYFTLFVDDTNVGQLCMAPEDASEFFLVLRHGLSLATDELRVSGSPYKHE
jgi:hypothetical protein